MTRISTPLFHQRNVNSLLDQQAKLSETQLKISSGKRLLSPADDPIGASRLLNLKQQETETENYQKSITTANFELESQEVQLDNAEKQILKAQELALAANNGSLTTVNRQTLASQLQNVLNQMVDIANANVDGNYLFSGSKTLIKPVILDANGVYQYRGDELNRQAQIGPSINVQVNDTAKRVFFQLETNDMNLTGISGRHTVTSANPGLVTEPALLQSLNSGELYINGIEINPATADGVSTTAATASAIATAAAINARTNLHGVVATANATTLDFTGGTYSSGVLAAGDFTINGIDIVGDIGAQTGADDLQRLINLINSLNIDGVVATSDGGGELRLTAADGRNIELDADGTTASGLNFGNFDINAGGGAVAAAARGTVTLNHHSTITITTNTTTGNANDVGFVPGSTTLTANSGTVTMSTPIVREALPSGASRDETYLIEFTSATTYQIYRESDPTTPVTGFKVYSAAQTYDDALTINDVPATFTTGDTIIVDGMEVRLTGVPVTGDTFTIDQTPVDNVNIFEVLQNLINDIQGYSTQPSRLSYNIGLAIINLENAANRVSEVRSEVGSRLNLVETQKRSNEEFIFFAKKAISEIEDLDIISAISTLVQQQLSYEAAQRSVVRIQQLSLFDFL